MATSRCMGVGKQSTITDNGKAKGEPIGWIVKRLSCTTGAEKNPYMAAVPSRYYGFKLNAFNTFKDADTWIREEAKE